MMLDKQETEKPMPCAGRCAIEDEAAAALAPLTKLADLDVRYCPMTNAGLCQLSRAMPDLAIFAVEGCPATSIGIWRLLSRHRNLKLWLPGVGLLLWRVQITCPQCPEHT